MSLVRCPTCGKRFDTEQSPAMPFCSERCRQIDLGRWLSEDMGLPLPPRRSDDDEQEWTEE